MQASIDDLRIGIAKILEESPARRHLPSFTVEPDTDADGDPYVRIEFRPRGCWPERRVNGDVSRARGFGAALRAD